MSSCGWKKTQCMADEQFHFAIKKWYHGVFHNSEGQSHKIVSTATRTTFEVKGKPKQIRTEVPGSAYQPRLIARPNRLTSTYDILEEGCRGKTSDAKPLGVCITDARTPSIVSISGWHLPREYQCPWKTTTYHSSWKSLGIDFCCCCWCRSFVVVSIHKLYWTADWPSTGLQRSNLIVFWHLSIIVELDGIDVLVVRTRSSNLEPQSFQFQLRRVAP